MCKRAKQLYIFCPPFFLSFFLCFFTTLDTEQPPFFPQHCHRLSRDSLDSFASAVFPLPSPNVPQCLFFFFPLSVLVSFPRLCPFAVLSRPSFSPPAAHHVLQYRRAASGVTPVIRDGPDEAFIILSERERERERGVPFHPTTHRYNTK